VLFANQENNRNGLFRLDTRSGAVERILGPDVVNSGHSQFAFDVTPDGSGLVYRLRGENRSARLLLRDLEAGTERLLASYDIVRGEAGELLAVSPDGRQVAYLRWRGTTAEGGEAVDLVVTSIAGEEGRVIPQPSGMSEGVEGIA
jgi:hypothetical protein